MDFLFCLSPRELVIPGLNEGANKQLGGNLELELQFLGKVSGGHLSWFQVERRFLRLLRTCK